MGALEPMLHRLLGSPGRAALAATRATLTPSRQQDNRKCQGYQTAARPTIDFLTHWEMTEASGRHRKHTRHHCLPLGFSPRSAYLARHYPKRFHQHWYRMKSERQKHAQDRSTYMKLSPPGSTTPLLNINHKVSTSTLQRGFSPLSQSQHQHQRLRFSRKP